MRRVVLLIVALTLGACRHAGSCDDVPATADGCRERCHDRGKEMMFFRNDPGTYRCEARCECVE